MEVPKTKGREAGLSMKAIEIKANQGVLLTILNDGQEYIYQMSPLPPYPIPPMHPYHVPDV